MKNHVDIRKRKPNLVEITNLMEYFNFQGREELFKMPGNLRLPDGINPDRVQEERIVLAGFPESNDF